MSTGAAIGAIVLAVALSAGHVHHEDAAPAPVPTHDYDQHGGPNAGPPGSKG